MSKKKVYAVKNGRETGLFDTWPEAEAQVKGFPNPVYRGFKTLDEALDWMDEPIQKKKKTKAKSSESKDSKPIPGEISIYTDGSSLGNPGPGGYGIVIIDEDGERDFSQGFSKTTNNRMELLAPIAALRDLERKDLPIRIFTDSTYVVNGISEGLAANWRKNNWRKSDGKAALNADLWEQLLEEIEGLAVTFQWVRGHNGNHYNEICDKLAVNAAEGYDLPEDIGYLG